MSVATTELSPNDVAVELTGRSYVSFSSISTFQRCPLQYYFRYVQQVPEETVSASLVFGSAIHSAVEFHYNELMSGNPAPDLDSLLFVYQDAWQSRDDQEIIFGKQDSVDSLGHLAERMLTAFRKSESCSSTGRILGVEEELRGSVFDGCPDLLGRVDLLTETKDEVTITDFKTSRSRWSDEQAVESSDQLLCYSELVRKLVPGKRIKLRFLVATKTKASAISEHVVPVSSRRVTRTKRMVQRVWKAIVGGHFYPVPSAMNCSGCPFKKACRKWSG